MRIYPLQRPFAISLRAAQALLDPAAILKELLENSLDAQATRIDLRLRGAGCLSSIVVSDNGRGIEEPDLDRVCLPSTTSKLSELVDIERIASFGFRGEALSAICGIARCVSIVSRTAIQNVARCAKYGTSGCLISKSPAARGVGTTVNVEDVFHRLPVRKKEALAHPARQLARCIAVVQAMALISVSVRIELRVGNDLKVANAPLLLQSKDFNASSSESFQAALRKNAIAVLGRSTNALRQVSGCVANVIGPGTEPGEEEQYKCSGLASSASLNASGGGRARSSHQYFFINRRPVDLSRLQRSVTELYRRATGSNGASPVIILNFELPLWAVDVNLSPDKRSVAVFEEVKLVDGLLRLLETFWMPTDRTQIPVSKVGDVGVLLTSKKQSKTPVPDQVHIPQMTRDDSEAKTDRHESGHDNSSSDDENVTSGIDPERPPELEQIPELPCLSSDEDSESDPGQSGRKAGNEADEDLDELEQSEEKEITKKNETATNDVLTKMYGSKQLSPGEQESKSPKTRSLKMSLLTRKRPHDVSSYVARRSQSSRGGQKRQRSTSPSTPTRAHNPELRKDMIEETQLESSIESHPVPEIVSFDAPRHSGASHSVQSEKIMIPVNWDAVCQGYIRFAEEERKTTSVESLDNRTGSCNFKDSSMQTCEGETRSTQGVADREMSRLFRQTWFKDLKVIGQFNRGFIIALLGFDMFIIDQHASDEKFNFEELERTTVISKQKLVRPMPLEFSAEDELIVLQYLDAFKAGGFDIVHVGTRPPTKRLLLRSQPTSKHTIFVREDLQDMINLLKNNAMHTIGTKITLLRPPRVRAMLASRACRKSIMVGKALSPTQMRTILTNLADLQHPWTCPHGRPTMRHLFELPKPLSNAGKGQHDLLV
ncbi:Histidine kinase [Gracilaria domingensis]|nr:Histidine kinase [Gracilaria domingensis]